MTDVFAPDCQGIELVLNDMMRGSCRETRHGNVNDSGVLVSGASEHGRQARTYKTIYY